ncbi:BspA family leucine-rich repeat surface protein [Lacticaseibacillus pantheris]
MKKWGTAMFARMRLIIKRRALPESGLTSPAHDSKPVATAVNRVDSLLAGPMRWLLAIITGWIAGFSALSDRMRNYGHRISKHSLRILLLPIIILGLGLTAIAVATPTQSVQAASTFNESAYNASNKQADWYIYTSLTSPTSAQGTGAAEAYLDSAGTLHVSGTKLTTALSATIDPDGFQLSDVKAISFEGPSVFIDKSIGLFQMFPNLQKITGLGNIDVSRMTTLDYLFSSHSNDTVGAKSTNALLTTIEGTSNWNTSNVTSMKWTFEDQPNLTSVDGIQNWNTSKVTSMSSLFYMDKSLVTLPDLSGWDTSKVTDTSYAFGNLDTAKGALTNIDSVRNWKMQSNTNIQGMFQNNPKLTFGGRFNWDTSSVTNFANVFWNDSGASSLNLSNWNVAKGFDFSQMFSSMTSLTNLDITGWQPTNADDMGFMFYNDAKLTTLPGVDGWTLGKATNLTSIFEGMSSVTDLPVSKWQLNPNGKTNITNVFWGDNALTKLDLSGWNISLEYDASDKVFPTYNFGSSTLQSQLKSITFGSGWTGKVVLPQFLIKAGMYGPWRGEKHDKANVAGVGTATETYTPPSTSADRVETFRFAYDIIAKIVNSQGQAMPLAGVPVTITGSDGSKVTSGNTGADGTVTLATNSTGGDYTASLGTLPGGYDASVDTATAKIDGADVEVTFVVDEQNDADLVNQYPHAGGHGTFLTVVAGVLAVVLGTTGMIVRRRA